MGDGPLPCQMYSELSKGDAQMIDSGTIIDGRWNIIHMMSVGGFGQVFMGLDMRNGERRAIKVESLNASIQLIDNEVDCLINATKYTRSISPLVQLYSYGCTNEVRYMVMELVGRNVRELKKCTVSDRFSLCTTLWIMKEMINALEFLHTTGWIHRDVKPPNFCISESGERRLYLIDFGMSRRYRDNDGRMKRKEDRCSFHGTVRYASCGCHSRKDVSRWDDLWSVYYIGCENGIGELPWRHSNDKNEVGKMKESIDLLNPIYWQPVICPSSIIYLRDILLNNEMVDDDISFYEEPPYNTLNQHTMDELSRFGWNESYSLTDWEILSMNGDIISSNQYNLIPSSTYFNQ